MFTISGKYGIAKILQTENMVEESCKKQIKRIMDNPVVENQNVVIMQDYYN